MISRSIEAVPLVLMLPPPIATIAVPLCLLPVACLRAVYSNGSPECTAITSRVRSRSLTISRSLFDSLLSPKRAG